MLIEKEKPTKKQLDFISDIEEFGVGVPKFTGKTKKEDVTEND